MDPFSILGLAENASPAEVKRAYRARLLEVHPDVIGEVGHQVTIDVIAAYQQALLIAGTNAATLAQPVTVLGFVPADHPAHDVGRPQSSDFVAMTFRAVA